MHKQKTIVKVILLGALVLSAFISTTGRATAQEILLNRGIEQYELGNKYAALKSLSDYINANPSDFRGYFWRSQLYIRAVSNRAALEDLNKVLELSSENADAYYLRGVVLMILKEPQNACRDLIRASELGQATAQGEARKYCN